jgi:hypothetical protein
MRRTICYAEAIALLGGQSRTVAALDRTLDGALLVATGGSAEVVASLLGARGQVVRLGHELVAELRDRSRGYARYERSQRLHAAHTVIAVTAFFTALDDIELPFDPDDLQLTRAEQLSVFGADSGDFVAAILGVPAPLPAPHRPYELALSQMEDFYERLAVGLVRFARGLGVWDSLDETDRVRAAGGLQTKLARRAVARYQELYRQLAADAPEFAWWSGQQEHQATRFEIRALGLSLEALEDLLRTLTTTDADGQAQLGRAYRAGLDRPILSDGAAPAGLVLPSLREGYVDPDFRVGPAGDSGSPASETYWDAAEVRTDLAAFLAAHLTGPSSVEAPLLVLGQPGAGKSVLTRILAARLPAAQFLPVRVELREVPADADLQDQIEHAIRATTGTAVGWPEFVRAAPTGLPVVLLDGFDELLQATGVSQSDYLDRVARFQRREADQGRPVAVVVTSRTAVADRARIPADTVVLRLEPFSRAQIEQWLKGWNRANAAGFAARGLQPLPMQTVERHGDLAGQPLLLLLLALYDGDANALQQQADNLDEAQLYERLLRAFADREVRKTYPGMPDGQLADLVAAELLRLSVVAFAMLNRGRQWVSAEELNADLTALVGDRPVNPVGFRAPLGHADIALGRFFFIQRAQAMRDGVATATFEFLHSTFGEYLIARLTHRVVRDLARQERDAATIALGGGGCQDGLLYALLSYAPLTVRGPNLAFLRTLARQLPPDEVTDVGALPVTLFRGLETRSDERFRAYQPVRWAVPARFGRYGLNLVLLAIVYAGQVRASDLVVQPVLETIATWRRHAQLWQAVLTWDEWRSVVSAVRVSRQWSHKRRDLVLTLDDRAGLHPAEPMEMYWSHNHPGWQGQTTGYIASRDVTWQEISRQAALVCDRAKDVAVHALEPLLAAMGPLASVYSGFVPWQRESGSAPDIGAATMLNALLRLWIAAEGDGQPNVDTVQAYRQVIHPLVNAWAALDDEARANATSLVLHRLLTNAAALPLNKVIEYVDLLHKHGLAPHHELLTDRILIRAVADRQPADCPEATLKDLIIRMSTRPASLVSLFVALHEAGLPAGSMTPAGIAQRLPQIEEEHPRLFRRARWLLQVLTADSPGPQAPDDDGTA